MDRKWNKYIHSLNIYNMYVSIISESSVQESIELSWKNHRSYTWVLYILWLYVIHI